MNAVIEDNERVAAGGEAWAQPQRYTAENAPLLVSAEDPELQETSSAVLIFSQQRDLVHMVCAVVQSEGATEQGAPQ